MNNKTIEKRIIGIFEIRLSESKIEIENEDKTWRHTYAAKTRPYIEITGLMARNNNDALYVLCNALYSTTMLCYDAKFCVKWLAISSKQAEKMGFKKPKEKLSFIAKIKNYFKK
jgi:hypothetical protein